MERFADGLFLPECPRWHAGALWLCDMWGHEVLRFSEAGARTLVHRFPDDEDPGGLLGGALGLVGLFHAARYLSAILACAGPSGLKEPRPTSIRRTVSTVS